MGTKSYFADRGDFWKPESSFWKALKGFIWIVIDGQIRLVSLLSLFHLILDAPELIPWP